MALTACPECHPQVSSIARTCPHCGFLLQYQASPSRSTDDLVQTIEQTGKAWKAAQLLGAVVLLVGIVWGMAGGGLPSAILGVCGLVAYIVGRTGAWWYHR